MGHFLSLFIHNKPSMGFYGWGLRFKNKFTSKKHYARAKKVIYPSSNLRYLLIFLSNGCTSSSKYL
jgi:hypothetical protein